MNMETKFDALLKQVETGRGSDWLDVSDLLQFCEVILAKNYGVARMEVIQAPEGTVGPNFSYEIYGLDGDEAWINHRDPKRSIDLVREKVKWAKEDGAVFLYKVWIGEPLQSP